MVELTITLSEQMLDALKQRAADEGIGDVSAYVLRVLWDQLRAPPVEDQDYGAPEHLEVRSRADLDRLLEEAAESGPSIELTPDAMARLKRECEQHAEALRRQQRPAKAS